MNKKLFAIVKYLLLLAIAAGLMFFAFKGVNAKEVISAMLKSNIFWILFSSLLAFFAFISRAFRWKLLIESTGYSPPLKKTFYAVMIGYFANLAFPRLGEVTRCGSLSKSEDIPFTSLLGTVVVERVIDIISLFACILLTAVLEYKRLGNFLDNNIIQPLVNKFNQLMSSALFLGALVFLVLGLLFLVFYYIKKIKQRGKTSRWVQVFQSFANGLQSISRLKRAWLFIFHSVLIWVLYYLGAYTCFFALPPTSHLGLNAALFILVAGGIAMSAPIQGGIGAYHLLVSQGLMLYGLSQQDGLVFATLVHALQLVLVVVFGGISMILLFSNKRKINKQDQNYYP